MTTTTAIKTDKKALKVLKQSGSTIIRITHFEGKEVTFEGYVTIQEAFNMVKDSAAAKSHCIMRSEDNKKYIGRFSRSHQINLIWFFL